MFFVVLLLDVLHETRKHLDEYGYRMFMKNCVSQIWQILSTKWKLNGEIIASCIHKSHVTSTCFPKYIISSNNFDRKTNNNWINWILLDTRRRKCKIIQLYCTSKILQFLSGNYLCKWEYLTKCLYHCIIPYQIPSKKYETKYFSCRTTYWSSYCFCCAKR